MLAGNLFESLHPYTFAPLRHLLVELTLEGNLLDTVPRDLFAGLSHLQVLNLRNNRLTKLAESTFRDQARFTLLALEGNRIEPFQRGFLKSEDVLLQNNRLPSLRKLSAVNVTLVRRLFLYGNEIASIEQDVFEALPKLETLYLDYNRISELSAMLFHTNHRLQHVTLAHNRLVVLRTNTFAGLGRLHSVDLSHNLLVALEESVFHGSPVEYLNLNGNRLQTLDDWTFAGTNLLYLHVDSNAIGGLQRQAHGGQSVLDGLLELSAANNHIARWQELCARNFSRLTAINLANNSLPSMDEAGCWRRNENSDRVTINVAFNKVSLVPEFAGWIQLLDLSGNNVQDLGDGHQFQGLESIDLSQNSLQTADTAWFQALEHLKVLNLEGNSISQLPSDLLSPDHSLELLSLAGNALDTISDAVFLADVPIKALNLSNNHLHDTAILRRNDFITELDVSGNRLERLLLRPNYRTLLANANRITTLEWDVLPGTMFSSLQQLHLADNQLDHLDQRLFQMSALSELDVSENRLDTFPFDQLYRLKRLVALIISRNNIRTLPAGDVQKFKLDRLDLSENPLEQVPERFLSSCVINDLIVHVVS
uniref:Uncharacterized protein n=1 Tax=Anopheles epiroticus TaxID=199890 RepID=A0A182P7Q6_9DIPT